MSPISIALPAPVIGWAEELYSPVADNTSTPNAVISGSNVAMGTIGMRPGLARSSFLDSSVAAVNTIQGYGAIGGGGTTNRWESRRGRPAQRTSTTAAQVGDMYVPPGWMPDFDESDISAGDTQEPAAIVGVFDWHLSLNLPGAPTWVDDLAGVFFLPFIGTVSINQVPGNVAADVGGFGVFLNTVAAAPAFEYVSWGSGSPGAILERITITAAQVPDVEDWNTIRFIIRGALPGAPAFLSVQANGFDVLVGRQFGSAFLNRPDLSAAGAAGFAMGQATAGPGGEEWWVQWQTKLGRFTPDGAEQQGQ